MFIKTLSKFAAAAAGLAAMIGAASAAPVTIDFDAFAGGTFGPGDSYSEDGYTFDIVSGTSTAILFPGNGGKSFQYGANSATQVGDTVSITRDDSADFFFLSLDYRSFFNNAQSDEISLIGLLNGVQVASFGNILSSTSAWTTFVNALAGTVIDELQLVGVDPNVQSLLLDNFVFAEVPLPAALPLFLAGLAGLGFAGKRKRKTA